MQQEAVQIPERPQMLLFDVYETLLDMTQVEQKVNDMLHNKKAYRIWLELLMEYTFLESATGQFHSFDLLSQTAIQRTTELLGQPKNDSIYNEIMVLMKHSPLQDGVQEGLSMLYEQNFRLAALTNSSVNIITERMEGTGLISYFDFVLSAEQVKSYKPAKAAYESVAKKAGLPVESILTVTSQAWDLCGAFGAGMKTAYIQQKGQWLLPQSPQPVLTANDLPSLARMLEELYPRTQR